MEDRKPLVAGNEKQGMTLAGVQAAVDAAGKSYRERFGPPSTHVALPPGLDPKGARFDTMDLGRETGSGMVIARWPAGDPPELGRDGTPGG